MDCSTPGFLVHHQLPEIAQTHVPRVGDAIQPSHPLSSPFPPTFNLYQRQGLFKWVSSSHQVAKVLEFQPQHQFFQWIFRTDFLQDGLVWTPCSPRDSQESSPTPQFKSISSSNIETWSNIVKSLWNLKNNGHLIQGPLAFSLHSNSLPRVSLSLAPLPPSYSLPNNCYLVSTHPFCWSCSSQGHRWVPCY